MQIAKLFFVKGIRASICTTQFGTCCCQGSVETQIVGIAWGSSRQCSFGFQEGTVEDNEVMESSQSSCPTNDELMKVIAPKIRPSVEEQKTANRLW